MNWELLIHKFVKKSLPHIGWKTSFLFPYILHLYQHCFTVEKEVMLTITADEVTYKLQPEAEVKDTRTQTSSDPNPVEPPTSPTPSFQKHVSSSLPHPHSEAQPSPEANWRNVDLSAWDFPENPFKWIHDQLAELQTQYY